ncbi:FHA domain-containing protein [Solimonas terrae]|uniref:FHA domain-containing protein n=1 Tax=Solimonas terrae TaxID=1396819 RepID=A0A6M2BNY6_9GAMM|nr:FHA domain-containing protein [Solimonas terrae]NGY03779.1 FHA domain-containing protein [Solimonas terrae]
MGKLIVTDGNGQVQEFALTKERLSIGRHPDNDIPLNDKAVSGRHAVVITILKDSFLEDLDSTNGTTVNGRTITKHPLTHGDQITIGRNTLKYESEAGGDDDFEKTMILKPGQFGTAFESQVQAATASAPPPTSVKPVLGKLRVVSGPNAGKELELSKALTTIGKPGVQVAAITRRADGYYIVHVGGETGTKRALVNGAEISTHARKLNPGDTIELLGTQMSFATV